MSTSASLKGRKAIARFCPFTIMGFGKANKRDIGSGDKLFKKNLLNGDKELFSLFLGSKPINLTKYLSR